MISRRVCDVIERFARHRNYVRLAKFKRVRGFDVERKLLRRPAKHNLSNLAPLWANGNFGANRSDVVSAAIYKCECRRRLPLLRQRRALSERTIFALTAFSPLSWSIPHSARALPMRTSEKVSPIESRIDPTAQATNRFW